jgi:hypothetical protein
MSRCNFAGAVMDGVDARYADLTDANFDNALMVDLDLTDAKVSGASFLDVDHEATSLIVGSDGSSRPRRLVGKEAIGYLRFFGAQTNDIENYYVYSNHPKFGIVEKIISNLSRQSHRQRRGLEQRGAAHSDVPFARSFVSFLVARKLLLTPKARKDLIEPSELGRQVFQDFVVARRLPSELVEFFDEYGLTGN